MCVSLDAAVLYVFYAGSGLEGNCIFPGPVCILSQRDVVGTDRCLWPPDIND